MSGAFQDRRVVVVGAGVAGAAAVRVLVEEGADVVVSETLPADELPHLEALRELGIAVAVGGHEPSHLDGATLLVTSPGVPQDAPILLWATESGIPVWGELELGAHLCHVPYVAVTGTNGKTTTTGMIASCLQAGGLDAVACGNIGHPFSLAAREGHEALVVEASSFQLRFVQTFHPRVSVLLNLAPDHLDWHGSELGYVDAKTNMLRAQGQGDIHVGNRDDDRAAAVSEAAPCPVVWFRLAAPEGGEVGYVDDELVSRLARTDVLGPIDAERAGFRADAAAAAAASLAFGVSTDAVRRGLSSFVPAHHRGEVVALVDGVRFVDNSKATNVHAALAALDGVQTAVLIAGGRAKGVDLSPLRSRVDRLAGVVALGEAALEIEAVFDGAVPVRHATSIEEATRIALTLSPRPGTVLLAPACASWDMFRDYAERGDRFAIAARTLMEEVGARG
ncbi:MAG: UDP-N-acetylmuramoyl-L-alanine--D-glutamate ligase [Actinomycetota bacterium]